MAEDRAWAFLGGYRALDFEKEDGLAGTGTGLSSDKRWRGRQRMFRKILRIRNEIRAAIDPIEDHLKWLVSGILTWTPGYNQIGFAFLVRHMNGSGSPTGPEWLFLLYGPDYNSTTNTFRTAFGANNDVNLNPYFVQTVSATDTGAGGAYGTIAVHYNSRSGLDSTGANNDRYQMGFDDFAAASYDWHSIAVEPGGAGTYTLNETIEIDAVGPTITATFKKEIWGRVYFTSPSDTDFLPGGGIVDSALGTKTRTTATPVDDTSGDFMDVANTTGGVNPYSNFPGFMNSNSKLKGMVLAGAFSTSTGLTKSHWGVLFDWTKPFIAVYSLAGGIAHLRDVVLMGKIIVPKVAAHNQSSDGVYFEYVIADGTRIGYTYLKWIEAFYDQLSSNRARWNSYTRTDFERFAGAPRVSDGLFEHDIIEISLSDEIKGRIDNDVMRVVGSSNHDYLRTFSYAEATYIKHHQYYAFPWKSGEPRFPPIPWGADAHTGNPNTNPGEIMDDRDI